MPVAQARPADHAQTHSDARLPNLAELEAAAKLVYAAMAPTPQFRWPLLEQRAGIELWTKHENHSPLGAFKMRGGLVYFDHLRRTQPETECVVCATRGNHGQSVAFAAAAMGSAWSPSSLMATVSRKAPPCARSAPR